MRARNDTYSPDRKKSRKQQHAYDAPLKATVQVQPSSSSDDEAQYEQDADGDCVRIHTARKKLQAPWVYVSYKNTMTETPEAVKTWLTGFADEEMLRGGPYYALQCNQPDDLGPFRIAQV